MSDRTKKTEKPTAQPALEENGYIIGIGASAGGLEALQKFLGALPADTGFPYIIIQHLSPDYKSLLGEILGKHTEMPVIQVEDGMDVNPNCVYVIQPGKNMRISNGKLILTAQKEKELNLPIDMFFRSLAEDAGPRAIAVILSGTGSDGSNGIRDIKEHDGMIIVQDPECSKFDGMPRSAMRTGLVDAQLTPENIAIELAHIAEAIRKRPLPLKTEKQVDEELMRKVYVILKKISNVNFTHYKQSTILRRIERRMMLVHKDSLSDYVDYLYSAPDEVIALSREVLIGVTNFFRDPEFFDILGEKAIVDILRNSKYDEPIRIWVAGCSTGEEAYSIAILFQEKMESENINRAVKIFATDLDVDSISKAGKGVFGDNIADSVSPARLSKFFTRKNNTYIINRDIRKMIVFSPHNVFQDPPFGKLDLISCRNMLIYFQTVLQNDLFAIFHASLKDRGYLFLGKSEAIGAFSDAFPVVDATAKIFTHRSDIKISGTKVIPFLQTTYLDGDVSDDSDGYYARRSISASSANLDQEKIDNKILERFMPASLVIDEKNCVTRVYGDSSNYVRIPAGQITNNVFELITENLRIPASTILKEARKKKELVQYKDIALHGEHTDAVITMTATPITKAPAGQEGLYVLVISEINQPGMLPDATAFNIDRLASQRIADLESELGEVQNRLDRSVAEQECVNEELQSANEELLTANEEMQSSNEELQSVNEELYTVNSEYQQKLMELASVNDDIANFLSSTLTGIIFVDNKLNIRRYTDYVTTEFSVMDHDIGRSLKFISYHFPTVDIAEICDNVLKNLIPDEREIITSKNKVFFMRVSPYRSTENKILGCVITLIDITKQKQGQVQLESTEKQLSRVAHEIHTPMKALSSMFNDLREKVGKNKELDVEFEKIGETIEYLSSIVTDVFEASKAEKKKPLKAAAPFALRTVIDRVTRLTEDRIKEADVNFEVSIADDFAPRYVGNDTALQQILIDFISNLLKFTSKGETISLKAYEDTDENVVNNVTTNIYFVIKSSSLGEKKKYISEVFDSKGNTETKNDELLGFSIAKNLIDSMNGTFTIEAAEGANSTFSICIPMRKYIEKPAVKVIDKEHRIRGCHVLVAEDNPLNRMLLGSILSKEGITFKEAEDGEEAVQLFINSPEHTFDFILMDMRMPKLDGIKATEAIRASMKADALTVPIIGVSANGFAYDIKKAREAGINEYVTKPINKAHLLETMDSLF